MSPTRIEFVYFLEKHYLRIGKQDDTNMIFRYYTAPAVRVAPVRTEKNFVFSPGSPDTNSDNNEKPIDDGNENF